MAIRSFCIHAHFYQPPREDPLTGSIPTEKGAAPYQNWNERIHAECYRPNAELHNFEQISFNVGPTLFAWMQGHDRQTCNKIVAQDQANQRRYGVGNAIAQAYNHTILPLASRRDKITQITWGIADFVHRFGRRPQGLWLPETAVDMETLDILASQGIEFTILAPWQAADEIDPSEPYNVSLDGGRSITVFFYQRDLSARVSFDPAATVNADQFAEQILLRSFNPAKVRCNEPQIILIASDGELYGHHQQKRDYFLARLLDGATHQLDIQSTFPALWLRSYPARRSARICEQTSWSCHHGVMRWIGNCACTPGDGSWKAQLRYALERLASELDLIYQDVTRSLGLDAWQLRNRYIEVMLGRVTANELITEMAGQSLTNEQVRRVYLLLEAQRERQRMFTSCGWFFEDFDRIEPKNNIAYAAQAVQLARLATGVDMEPVVASDLHRVMSNRSNLRADFVFQSFLHRSENMQILCPGWDGV